MNRTTAFRPERLVALIGIVGFCVLAGFAGSARATTTDTFFASPSGSGSCNSPAHACSISTAVADANAATAGHAVVIELASGTYSVGAELAVTFAGSVTFEPTGGTPILDGGGAVRIMSVAVGSNVTVDGIWFKSGLTAGLGGAILNNGTLKATNTTFSGNAAANGGGISNSAGATLKVSMSTFSANTTTGVGGGAFINFGTATVERSALLDNTAAINGGAINTQSSGTTTLSESTLSGNTSGGQGGAISNLGAITVEASTIMGNTGAGAGSAFATGNADVTFAANIIARNTGGDACSPANAAYTDAGYNLDDSGTCLPLSHGPGSHSGTEAVGSSTYGALLDAYLASNAASHGGPTKTVALRSTPSPATAEGDPAHLVVPPGFNLPVAVDGVSAVCSAPDQRGLAATPGAKCDIGAYQLVTQSSAALRAGYCSATGDTWEDGTAIPPGTFLNLEVGQPATDALYTGATPANYFEGIGITCDVLPGYTVTDDLVGSGGTGTTGIYPYYAKNP